MIGLGCHFVICLLFEHLSCAISLLSQLYSALIEYFSVFHVCDHKSYHTPKWPSCMGKGWRYWRKGLETAYKTWGFIGTYVWGIEEPQSLLLWTGKALLIWGKRQKLCARCEGTETTCVPKRVCDLWLYYMLC